jgi:hypothetical protein
MVKCDSHSNISTKSGHKISTITLHSGDTWAEFDFTLQYNRMFVCKLIDHPTSSMPFAIRLKRYRKIFPFHKIANKVPDHNFGIIV